MITAKRLAALSKKLKEVADECNSIEEEIFETYVKDGNRSNPVMNAIMHRNDRNNGNSEFEILAAQIKSYKAAESGAIPFDKVTFSTNNINDMLDFFSKVFMKE